MSSIGWIENPCRWNGWCASVMFVTVSSSVSPSFAYASSPRAARPCSRRESRVALHAVDAEGAPTFVSWMSWLGMPGLAGTKAAGSSSVRGRGAEDLDWACPDRRAQRRAVRDRVRPPATPVDVEVRHRHRRDVRRTLRRCGGSPASTASARRSRWPGSPRRRRRGRPGRAGSRPSAYLKSKPATTPPSMTRVVEQSALTADPDERDLRARAVGQAKTEEAGRRRVDRSAGAGPGRPGRRT